MRSLALAWNGHALAGAFLPAVLDAAEAYISDRNLAGLTPPDRQAVIDRLWHLAAGVVPPGVGVAGTINSAELNRWLVIEDKAEAPWFGVTTAENEPGGG